MPSEFLHSGATTKAIPFTKRSRNMEDDGRSVAEKITRKSASEEQTENNVSSTAFGDEKVGEVDGEVGDIDEKGGESDENVGETEEKKEGGDDDGGISKALNTTSSLKKKAKNEKKRTPWRT